MKRFYTAVRGKITTPGPARPVFRSNADMMLLTTRLHIDPDGKAAHPRQSGSLARSVRAQSARQVRCEAEQGRCSWKDPDDVLEALFALCRKPVDNEPLKIFMALTDIDRGRAEPLDAARRCTRLVKAWNIYGAQYTIFSDAPSLTDKTIVAWLDAAESVDKIRDSQLRQDTIGMMQGLTGIWQIFCRQGSIPDRESRRCAAGHRSLRSSRQEQPRAVRRRPAGPHAAGEDEQARTGGTVQDACLACSPAARTAGRFRTARSARAAKSSASSKRRSCCRPI